MSNVVATEALSYAEALALAEAGGVGARPINRNGLRAGRTMAGAGWGQLADAVVLNAEPATCSAEYASTTHRSCRAVAAGRRAR